MKPPPYYGLTRPFQNMWRNLFPNVTTIGIITISVLIFSTFSLIAFNLASFLKIWEEKIEVIAYLKGKTPISEVESLLEKSRRVEGVESVKYVSPSDAMAFMETRLGSQRNLLEGIQPTVLPPSFEVQLKKDYRNPGKIKEIVSQLRRFNTVRSGSKPSPSSFISFALHNGCWEDSFLRPWYSLFPIPSSWPYRRGERKSRSCNS
jgi:cell division protein FtsX